MNIGFVGLGKLGLPVATTLAAKGHTVVGYDPEVSGFPAEPERQEQGWGEIIAAADSFRFGTLTEACSAEVVFVAVQTPHDPEYEGITPLPDERRDFHYGHLVHAVQLIAAMCADHDLDPIVAVISTVLPGTMEREIIPELGGLRLVYNPSFIAMGTVIDDFLQPEFVLLGGDETGEVRRVYEEVGIDRFCEVSIPSAELAKVAYNTFISMKLAVANTLGEICHKTAANADEVTGALKLADRRLISGAYLDAGMGDGGGCFPAGELVITEHGPRPIESIERGDRVLAGDGVLRSVIWRWERDYDGEMVEVSVEGMPPVRATADHPFFVATDGRPAAAGRKHHPAYGPVAEHMGELRQEQGATLDVGTDFAAWPHVCEDHAAAVPDHATPEYLEVAGWYLAEGSIERRLMPSGNVRSARVRFDLHADEVVERERIAELLPVVAPPRKCGRGAGAQPRVAVKDRCASVRYGSITLAEQLLADFGKGCAAKVIPSWLLWGPLDNARLLLKGMILGDGHIAAGGVHYSTTSPDLAYGALILLDRLGIPANLRHSDRVDRLRQYEVRIRNGPDATRLADLLGIDGPAASRKGSSRYPDRGDGHLYRRIRKVERRKFRGKVYNLWVDGEHSYVTNAGRVANCHPRDNIALSWLARELDLSYDIFEASMLQRERHAAWLADLLQSHAEQHNIPCGILGVAYKPASALVTGSPALLVHTLLDHGSILVDPYVDRFDRPLPEIPCAWLIGCKHPEFPDWEFPEGSVIVDPWRYMPDREGVEVIRIGE